MQISNHVDPKVAAKSFRVGNQAEHDFMERADALAWNPRKSTERQDIYQHIDCWINLGGETLSVDIKAPKSGTERGLYAVELKNVRGNLGWLYGNADLIAFQQPNGNFMLVQRTDINIHVDLGANPSSKFCAPPNYYSRNDRPQEAVTWLTRNYLRAIMLGEI